MNVWFSFVCAHWSVRGTSFQLGIHEHGALWDISLCEALCRGPSASSGSALTPAPDCVPSSRLGGATERSVERYRFMNSFSLTVVPLLQPCGSPPKHPPPGTEHLQSTLLNNHHMYYSAFRVLSILHIPRLWGIHMYTTVRTVHLVSTVNPLVSYRSSYLYL